MKQLIKRYFDKIKSPRLKTDLLNAFPFWIGALLTGATAVAYAWLFARAEKGAHYIMDGHKWIIFIIAPACFFIAWALVNKYAPYARGSGIPQVTAAIELAKPGKVYLLDKLLGLRVLMIKILSSLIMVFGGGAIGREGPTIQISASIFKVVNGWLPAWYPKISRQNMLVTGAAAGLAAAFNTPLGGIVFAIEELTKTHFNFFKSALLTGVIIAGLTALYFLGPYLYLGYPEINGSYRLLIFPVMMVAAISSLGGTLMGTIILKILKWKSGFKHSYYHILFVLTAGLITATIAYFLDTGVLGSGKELMVKALFTPEKHLPAYMPALRFAGPLMSFSTGASGGIFAPSLSLGSSVGSVGASLFHLTASNANILILCGMAASLTGITRSPFTASILVLEMTNSHYIIFYIMFSALLANVLAKNISKHSFYDYLKFDCLKELHGKGNAHANKVIK